MATVIESIPVNYTEEQVNDPKIVIGVCECPIPLNHGHVFAKADHPSGHIKFKCMSCGLVSNLYFKTYSKEDIYETLSVFP